MIKIIKVKNIHEMSGEYNCCLFGVFFQEVPSSSTCIRIHSTGWLIQKYNIRVTNQSDCTTKQITQNDIKLRIRKLVIQRQVWYFSKFYDTKGKNEHIQQC